MSAEASPYLPQRVQGVLGGGGGGGGAARRCSVATHVSPCVRSAPPFLRLSSGPPPRPRALSRAPSALPLTLLPELCSKSPSDHLPAAPQPGWRRRGRRNFARARPQRFRARWLGGSGSRSGAGRSPHAVTQTHNTVIVFNSTHG